jgi:Methyltransferase domain
MASAVTRPFAWFAAGIGWRMRALSGKVHDAWLAAEGFVWHVLGHRQSQTRLTSDSQTYWNGPSNPSLRQNSHWRGIGIFADDTRWLTLGLDHLRLYQESARVLNLKHPLTRIVEWGCGGGVNAIHFGHVTDEYCGVDISQASLEECHRQMTVAGLQNFTPLLIDASNPEAVLGRVRGRCDLFLSTYVFELLPTPEYGIRVVRIAYELLADGGVAIIQIKYTEGNARTASRASDYARNLAWNATYRIEEFWLIAQGCGFSPKMVTLVPKQPLVNDRNYAYFLLVKQLAE